MLVTYAQPAGELLHFQGITGIGSQNIIQVFVVGTMVFIEFIIGLLPCGALKTVVLGSIVAKDVFNSGFYCLKSATIIQYTIKGRFMSR